MKSIGSIWMNDSFYEIKENVDQSMHRHHSNVCYLDVSATTLMKPLTWRKCKIIHFLEQSLNPFRCEEAPGHKFGHHPGIRIQDVQVLSALGVNMDG